MSDFFAFVRLGFGHIVSLDAMDHLLFLLALAAVYRLRDWRALLWAVSAFTVGHTISLALTVTNVLEMDRGLVEFLIPVTIAVTAIANLVTLRHDPASRGPAPRVGLFTVFGLIHGAGFANYLRELFIDSVAVPLAGFNVGIELGQLLVIAVGWGALAALQQVSRRARWFGDARAYRLRVAAVSAIVVVVSTGWTVARLPW